MARSARPDGGALAIVPSGPEVHEAPDVRVGTEVLEGVVRAAGHGTGGVRVMVSGAAKEVLSDELGHFRIDGLRPGRHALRALGESLGLYRDGIDVPAEGGKPIDLTLAPAPALHGRVVDEKGAPLAGAELTLREGLFAPLPRAETSDASGAFRFPSVVAGRYLLGVAADGFVPSVQPARAPQPGGLVVKLTRGATLVGDVIDEAGRPVAGARVSTVKDDGWSSAEVAARTDSPLAGGPLLEPSGELGVVRGPIPYPPLDGPIIGATSPAPSSIAPAAGAPHAPKAIGAGSVLTDLMGHFRLGDLAPGTVIVVVSHPAYIDTRSANVELAAQAAATIRLTMRAALTLRGHVSDGSGGAVSGAELWLGGQLAGTSDKRGRFELRRLTGTVEVEVRARGHAPARRRVDPRSENDVELVLGLAAEKVSGVILDSRGQPVAGARVILEGREGPPIQLVTDANGEFTATPSPPSPIKVRATHGEHLPAEQANVMPGDDVRLTLASGGVIEGEVMDDRGALPSGVKLFVDDASGARRTGSADRMGRFRIAGLAPGGATLGVEAPSYVPVRTSVDLPAADIAGEVVLRGIRFTLVEAGTVMGSVRDRWGAPVVGAQVEGGGNQARTDASGHFSLGNVAIGRVEVSARAGGGEVSEPVTVQRGRAANVDLRMP